MIGALSLSCIIFDSFSILSNFFHFHSPIFPSSLGLLFLSLSPYPLLLSLDLSYLHFSFLSSSLSFSFTTSLFLLPIFLFSLSSPSHFLTCTIPSLLFHISPVTSFFSSFFFSQFSLEVFLIHHNVMFGLHHTFLLSIQNFFPTNISCCSTFTSLLVLIFRANVISAKRSYKLQSLRVRNVLICNVWFYIWDFLGTANFNQSLCTNIGNSFSSI